MTSRATRVQSASAALGAALGAPAHAQQGPPQEPPLTAASRREVLEGTLASISRHYIDAAMAERLDREIRQRWRRRAYDTLTSPSGFARRVSEDLQGISGDLHLRLVYSPRPLPPRLDVRPPESPEQQAGRKARHAEQNFGFSRASRLDGNVGYIDLRGFADPEIAADAVRAAMEVVQHTDALIIDLRRNRGGEPEMVQHLASYFFAQPVHYVNFVARTPEQSTSVSTLGSVPGPRYLERPVYILTSARYTFSAAEGFAYALQSLGRATVVGEQTGGGTNPANGYRINDHFGVSIPYARPVSPVTGTNWEKGIRPDVPAADAAAVSVAHAHALEALLARDPRKLAGERQQALDELRRAPAPAVAPPAGAQGS